MNDMEVRANAIIAELSAQRNEALNRAAALAAELAVLKAKAPPEPEAPKEPA